MTVYPYLPRQLGICINVSIDRVELYVYTVVRGTRMKKNKSYTLYRLINKAENLEKKIYFDLKKTGTAPIDTYKNRCLMYAERVNNLIHVSDAEKDRAKRRIFKVYFRLQDYSGSEATKEESLEDFIPELDMAIIEAHSADVRSGGLGFSSTNNMMMVEGLRAPKNKYWSAANSVKTQGPMCSPNRITYKPRESMVQYREEMKRQKKEILDGL